MKMKLAALSALVVLFYAISVHADIEEANTAFDKGDYTKALEKVRPLAQQGNAAAQNILGVMYENGKGVSKDYRQAIEWIRKAAEQGLAKAQNNLGGMYDLGIGVPKDYSKALKWYRRAANQGFAGAQHNLGAMYFNGNGVQKNEKQAVEWLRKAADQGDSDSQRNLGDMYANGIGVPKDSNQAMVWYQKAAAQGNAVAQYDLGAAYIQGQGVKKDYGEGLLWIRKAAAQGDVDAQKILFIAERDSQSYFEHIRTRKAKSYNNAINEIQKSAIFNQANAETSAFISRNGAHFAGWVGKISAITTSHGGKDVFIAIDSPWGATYEINKNAPLGSPIYQQASTLKDGQRVKFSGTLIPAIDGPNHWERSITEVGSLLNPEFWVIFDNIEPAQIPRRKHNP